MIRLILSAALCVALAAPPAFAQQAPTTSTTQQGGTIRGTVKSGTTPLPGVTITATNTLSGKKYSASTDVNGNFAMAIPKNGRYVLRTDFPAFAAATKELLLNATNTNQQADFTLVLTSRAEQAADRTE